MVKAQFYTVAKIFDGDIKESDLTLQEEELPPLQDGEFLVECLYLSVDPYMRAYGRQFTIGQEMIGGQVAKIIESKDPDFPVGENIYASLGWRTHTIVKKEKVQILYIVPNFGTLPISVALGALGMTGVSAYFGFLDICNPVEGETVVVSGAAGAVGNQVGQIAKIKGCRVVGLTGSDEKVSWLESLGFDYVINYKTTPNLAEELRKAAPTGIDCYFDNVGGVISSTILEQMNLEGRVSVCGSISAYNAQGVVTAPIVQPIIVLKHLTLKGFVSIKFKEQWMDAIQQNLEWIQEGKLKYRETITEGFENATKALMGVMKGENIGKAAVRVKTKELAKANAFAVEEDAVDFTNALNMFRKMEKR